MAKSQLTLKIIELQSAGPLYVQLMMGGPNSDDELKRLFAEGNGRIPLSVLWEHPNRERFFSYPVDRRIEILSREEVEKRLNPKMFPGARYFGLKGPRPDYCIVEPEYDAPRSQ